MCLTKTIPIRDNMLKDAIQVMPKEALYNFVLKHFFKTADKDIEVWKSAREMKGKRYYTPHKYMIIKKGMHYYQTDKEPKFTFISEYGNATRYSEWTGCLEINVHVGLHSYTDKTLCNDDIALKAIIPKGSRYLQGNNGDIVSDNLIIL